MRIVEDDLLREWLAPLDKLAVLREEGRGLITELDLVRFYIIPNGMKMARSQIEQLATYEQRTKEAVRNSADATKRADAKVNAVKVEADATVTAVMTDADAKMVTLRSEHAAKLGELSATRQRLSQHEQQTVQWFKWRWCIIIPARPPTFTPTLPVFPPHACLPHQQRILLPTCQHRGSYCRYPTPIATRI